MGIPMFLLFILMLILYIYVLETKKVILFMALTLLVNILAGITFSMTSNVEGKYYLFQYLGYSSTESMSISHITVGLVLVLISVLISNILLLINAYRPFYNKFSLVVIYALFSYLMLTLVSTFHSIPRAMPRFGPRSYITMISFPNYYFRVNYYNFYSFGVYEEKYKYFLDNMPMNIVYGSFLLIIALLTCINLVHNKQKAKKI